MGKTLHKLHLYLGLLSSLVLIVVALSGAILSYEKQILSLIHEESFVVKPSAQNKLTPQEIVERFLAEKPDAKINAFTLHNNATSSYVINIASQKSRKGENYFIDPYTAKILPEVTAHDFFHFVENLHRRLLLGEVGKQITGASVLILIYLLFSGVYIYMPKIKRGFINALKIKTNAKGRSFLYSLHGSVGLWIVPVYLSISLTGLYWSYHWYNDFLHNITGVEKHKKPHMKKEKTKANKKSKQMKIEDPRVVAQKIQNSFDLFDKSVNSCYEKVMLRLPKKGPQATLFYIDKKPAHVYARNKMLIDMKTMQIKTHERYDDSSLEKQLMSSIFALHSGEYFGWIGQLIFFIAALMMPVLGITGLMLYLNRRKREKNAH